MMKQCNYCGRILDDTEFYTCYYYKGGLSACCKDCHREYARNNKRKDPQKNKEAVYKWRREHPEKAREAARKQYWKDPEKVRMQSKKWRENNKEKYCQYQINYYTKKLKELETSKITTK